MTPARLNELLDYCVNRLNNHNDVRKGMYQDIYTLLNNYRRDLAPVLSGDSVVVSKANHNKELDAKNRQIETLRKLLQHSNDKYNRQCVAIVESQFPTDKVKI